MTCNFQARAKRDPFTCVCGRDIGDPIHQLVMLVDQYVPDLVLTMQDAPEPKRQAVEDTQQSLF